MALKFNPITGQLDLVGSSESGPTRIMKTGIIPGTSFAGTPKKYSVVFVAPFASTNYSIALSGTDGRSYTYESKLTTGFVINANASTAIGGEVSWTTTIIGES